LLAILAFAHAMASLCRHLQDKVLARQVDRVQGWPEARSLDGDVIGEKSGNDKPPWAFHTQFGGTVRLHSNVARLMRNLRYLGALGSLVCRLNIATPTFRSGQRVPEMAGFPRPNANAIELVRSRHRA
jgi:hypothetical protein